MLLTCIAVVTGEGVDDENTVLKFCEISRA